VVLQDDAELICKNAMYYNAKNTIYYKQAKAIKELLEKLMKGFETGPQPEGNGSVVRLNGVIRGGRARWCPCAAPTRRGTRLGRRG